MVTCDEVPRKMGTEGDVLVVDLDGTLVHSDLLIENLFLFLRRYPLRVFSLFGWLMKGKAFLKQRLADEVLPSVESLPYNRLLTEWLEQRRRTGTRVVLATASDRRIAERVAEKLGIFDEVLGTEDGNNLSSKNKRDELVHRYGEKGFEYVGNSTADLAVWASARKIHVVNAERGVLSAARRIGPVDNVFENRPNYWRTLVRALRIHQWAKNFLIFVPLLASHRILEPDLVWQGVLAFFAFGACASSVYLLNDLLDLQDDRTHRTKRFRPLAAGTLPIFHAVLLIPSLVAGAVAISLVSLPVTFIGVLLGYYLLTIGYSLWAKRFVILDVVTLALLYTVRVVAGAAAMSLIVTSWILAFCLFIFVSLAFVKRYTELYDARESGSTERTAGRGYFPADFELLASLGGASGYLSVLVLALYINEAANGTLYASPKLMWVACPLLMFWISRVWLIAHRGEMHDDPIVFALRDRVSRWIGMLLILVFGIATV